MWVFHNFFQPVMRLEEKLSVSSPDKPHRIKRHFDRSRTPLDRLLETDALDEKTKAYYLSLRKQTNPLILRENIYTLIHELLNLPEADEKQVQSVLDTLKMWDRELIPPVSLDPGVDCLFDRIYSYRKESTLR